MSWESEVAEYIELLKHDDDAVRINAAVNLGNLGHVDAIGPLLTAMSDESQQVRSFVSDALKRLNWDHAVDRYREIHAVSAAPNAAEQKEAEAARREEERCRRERTERERAEQEQKARHRQEKENTDHNKHKEMPVDYQWCYTLLGVSNRATLGEINRAYRRKAKVHHPDHEGDGDVMRMLNDAVSKLRSLHRGT